VRPHGIPKETYEKAKEANIELIDLTCPKVLKVHGIAEEHEKQGYYIFLVCKKGHPETIGTSSFCGDTYNLIEDLDDIDIAIEDFKKSGKEKLVLISQTTISLTKFDEIAKYIETHVPTVKIINTICDATRIRQEETKTLSGQVEYMIIIGGKHSSNSTKLYEVAKKHCNGAVHIETKDELNIETLKQFSKIGIMVGVTTPQKSIEEVVRALSQIGD